MPTLVELMSVIPSDEAPLETAYWDGVPLWTSSTFVEAPPSQPGGWVLYEDEGVPQPYFGMDFDILAKTRCVR